MTSVATYLAKIRTHVAKDFGPDLIAHDIHHLDRVRRNCEMIADHEGGDRLVLIASAYLHDYHRVVEHRTGSWVRPTDALEPVLQALRAVSFPRHLRERVVSCVIATGTHSFAGDRVELALEERIVRDADVLDALGAVGIARAFAFGGAISEPLWWPGDAASTVYHRGQAASVVHHFHEKLLKLRDDMSTETGRRLAATRHSYMVEYLRRLADECEDRRILELGGPQGQ